MEMTSKGSSAGRFCRNAFNSKESSGRNSETGWPKTTHPCIDNTDAIVTRKRTTCRQVQQIAYTGLVRPTIRPAAGVEKIDFIHKNKKQLYVAEYVAEKKGWNTNLIGKFHFKIEHEKSSCNVNFACLYKAHVNVE